MRQKEIDLLRIIFSNSLQVKDYKVLHTFLMPDEENLGIFSQMGFHIISCVEWLMTFECVYECQVVSYCILMSYC